MVKLKENVKRDKRKLVKHLRKKNLNMKKTTHTKKEHTHVKNLKRYDTTVIPKSRQEITQGRFKPRNSLSVTYSLNQERKAVEIPKLA